MRPGAHAARGAARGQAHKQGSGDVFGEESGIRPIEGLVVFRASSTGASEESGVAPPEFDFDPGVMAASAARMGLAIPPGMLAE